MAVSPLVSPFPSWPHRPGSPEVGREQPSNGRLLEAHHEGEPRGFLLLQPEAQPGSQATLGANGTIFVTPAACRGCAVKPPL